MITKIICPKCNTETGFSVTQLIYQGPFRCWKCKEFFTIKIEKGTLISCEPLSQEEFSKLQGTDTLKAKSKYL